MTRLGAFPQILILRYVLIPCLYGPQFNVKLEEEVVDQIMITFAILI